MPVSDQPLSGILWPVDECRLDGIMPGRVEEVLDMLLKLSDDQAVSALGSPASIHQHLYAGLTPFDNPEFAGNYRGCAHASLMHVSVAFSYSATEGTKLLAGPESVAGFMADYAKILRRSVTPLPWETDAFAAALATPLSLFGMIHPFLDGNGHIQRLTFEHLARRAGFEMSSDWSVHPKPYGVAMDRMLASYDRDGVAAAFGTFISKPPARC